MPYILCYTKPGEGLYPDHNYPGHKGWNCDWEHAVHLAISDDGEHFTPLRNNSGILFAKATFDEGEPQGTTKTLIDPWLCRAKDGSLLLCALRRNRNAPDPRSVGAMMLFTSKDLVRYEEAGFLKVSDAGIRRPGIKWQEENDAYALVWEDEQGRTTIAQTRDLRTVENASPDIGSRIHLGDFGIEGCIPGNVIEITDAEAAVIRAYLDEIRHVAVEPITCTVKVGTQPSLPRAVCVYSDGSTHEKAVDWDLSGVDLAVPGVYQVPGSIRMKRYPFPMELNYDAPKGVEIRAPQLSTGMSDPCVTEYKGKYYLSSSGSQNIVLRCADRPEDVFAAPPVIIYQVPMAEDETHCGTWAAELHEINGVLYMLTSLCHYDDWTHVKSVILRCNGDPLDRNAWEEPKYCLRPDGQLLCPDGISLDMTYFEDAGRHYVMWSNRVMHYGTDPIICEPADVYIATIDPDHPWQLTSEPVCAVRPIYGWDRYETEVDEGPYLLRHGDDMFVTISGSSTGMTDLYDVGLLRAKTGTDLLDPASWDWLPYPLLTKESVPGEFGPGHNNFVRDPETGDDLMIYHAVPHDEQDRTLGRQPCVRRVHWAKTGLPYLEMTPDKDLNPALAQVVMTLEVANEPLPY